MCIDVAIFAITVVFHRVFSDQSIISSPMKSLPQAVYFNACEYCRSSPTTGQERSEASRIRDDADAWHDMQATENCG